MISVHAITTCRQTFFASFRTFDEIASFLDMIHNLYGLISYQTRYSD